MLSDCRRSHPGTLENKPVSRSSTTVKHLFYECQALSIPLFFLVPTRERLPTVGLKFPFSPLASSFQDFRCTPQPISPQELAKTPEGPSAINQQIGEDSPLERICLKMIAKSPADRYHSMAEVAAALDKVSSRGGDAPITKEARQNKLSNLGLEVLG